MKNKKACILTAAALAAILCGCGARTDVTDRTPGADSMIEESLPDVNRGYVTDDDGFIGENAYNDVDDGTVNGTADRNRSTRNDYGREDAGMSAAPKTAAPEIAKPEAGLNGK